MSEVSHSTNLNFGNSGGGALCPFCSERNPTHTQVCKHCGENMSDTVESHKFLVPGFAIGPAPWTF